MSGSRSIQGLWSRSRLRRRIHCRRFRETNMATAQQEHLKIKQLRQQSADELEHIAGREKENLEGWIPSFASEDDIREALEKAFDYRGDVTITMKDGRVINGYIFDRRTGQTLATSAVRIIPATERTKLTISYSDI